MPVTQTKCIACGSRLPVPILSRTGRLCVTCSNQGLFRKQVIITGITRMNGGNVCVSGIDPQTWNFVRPVFQTGLDRDFLMHGTTQVVNHFNLVEIEFKRYNPSQTFHTEDWIINENFAPRFIRHLTNQEIIDAVNHMTINNLNSAVERQDKSLFIVKAQSIGRIWHEQYEKFKVRINFVDWDGNLYERVPVTDLLTLAFVRYQISMRNMNYGGQILRIFNNNPNRFVRIGLTREWQGQHWKQVTALITIPDLFDGNSFSYYENRLGEQV
jgi:hypothetical protein